MKGKRAEKPCLSWAIAFNGRGLNGFKRGSSPTFARSKSKAITIYKFGLFCNKALIIK